MFKEIVESLMSYVIALGAILFTALSANLSTIMTVGGLVLLLLRLYVDITKAYRTYKEHKEWNDYRGG